MNTLKLHADFQPGTAWVQTRSGKQINLLQPDLEAIDIEDIAIALSNICRFNGHTAQFYSVAQHSVLVSHLCRHSPRSGLLHDAHEAYVGDMVRPVKAVVPAFNQLEADFQNAIARRFALAENFAELDEVKYADLLALAIEKQCLMSGCAEPWPGLPEALPVVLVPQSPEAACQSFLERFHQLTPGLRNQEATA